MNNIERFDKKVEDFLKKRLSQEEEAAFIAELQANPDLQDRAKIITLFIDELGQLRSERDASIIKQIASLSNEEYQNTIWSNDVMSQFDTLTSRFLKKQLNKEEETLYLQKLDQIPSLRKRAQVIALTVQQIDSISKAKSKDIIERISKQSEVEFRRATNLPAKRISFWPQFTRYAAAASIILVIGFGGYKYYQYDMIVSLGTEYYQPMDDSFRSGSDETIKELAAVFRNVENGQDLDNSIKKLCNFYALAKSEEFTDYSLYTVDIAWNLAIAYLKDNNAEEAVKILKEVIEDNQGKAIAQRAEELINRIEEI